MVKIAFHTPVLDVRGTCVSLYDYADYNEKLLGNDSIIIVPANSVNDPLAVRKFTTRFQIIYYTDLERAISDCNILYCIKYGKNDNVLSKKIKTVIHCVFDLSEPHGDVYAAVSETLAKKFNRENFVPHMIGLQPSLSKDNLRDRLGIPENAIVFGRHGGLDTFDLQLTMNAIKRVVLDFDNIYFVFIGTRKFHTHPHIYFLDNIVDLNDKNRFISTCDAMIHAQSLGETFGLSIGEFSVNNKPIITWDGPVWNDNHIKILGDRAIYYRTEQDCYNVLTTFNPRVWKNKDNNCYTEYTPEKVMQIFKRVFID